MAATVTHTLYDNKVIEAKVTDISNTKLNVFPLLTIDRDLAQEAGEKKVINRYRYTGESKKLARGEGNTESGVVTFTPVEYTVGLSQQMFVYYDEDVRKDPKVVDVGVNGMGVTIANEIKAEYFTEINKTTTVLNYSGALSYDAVVDATAKMNLEEESGLFLLINPSQKAEIRKDSEFKSVGQGKIIVDGHIGFVNGIPVLVSKLVTNAIVATKEAVTLFIKVESEVEQAREANVRKNSVFARRVNLMALTDATKAVKMVKSATLSVLSEEVDAEVAEEAEVAEAEEVKETPKAKGGKK